MTSISTSYWLSTNQCCPILTQYTASSPRNTQLSQLDLVWTLMALGCFLKSASYHYNLFTHFLGSLCFSLHLDKSGQFWHPHSFETVRKMENDPEKSGWFWNRPKNGKWSGVGFNKVNCQQGSYWSPVVDSLFSLINDVTSTKISPKGGLWIAFKIKWICYSMSSHIHQRYSTYSFYLRKYDRTLLKNLT